MKHTGKDKPKMDKKILVFFCFIVVGFRLGLMAQDQKTNQNQKGQIITLDPAKLDSANRNHGTKPLPKNPAGATMKNSKVDQKELTPQEKQAQTFTQDGVKKAKEQNYDGAIQDFTKSIKAYENAIAYMNRGYCYMIKARYDLAIEDENKAINLSKSYGKAYFVRGACKFHLNDFDGSEKDLTDALKFDHKNPAAFNYMAAINLMKKDYQGALENYNVVIRLDSSYPDVFTNRAMVRHNLQDYNGAILDCNTALKRNPNNVSAYNNRGATKILLKDYQGALLDLNKAIELSPSDADAFNNRGKVKQFLGDTEGACKDWNKAFDLGITESKDLIIKYCK